MQMAYSYTRSKFNFAQNILTVQRTGRIPFTIIFAQFFHKFNHPKVTSYWLYQCPRLTPSPPPPQILHDHCFQFFLGITVVPRDEDNKTMVMLFFWCGVGGGAWGETICIVVYVKIVNCWVFGFPSILQFQKNFQRPRCDYTCWHWGSLMTWSK